MRRPVSEEERRQFEEDFRLARPIKPKPRSSKPKKTRAPKKAGGEIVRAAQGTTKSKLNGATQDRLDRGLVAPQARLDLHGMTQAAAHRALDLFLAGARARDYRLVLVVTGKGNPREADAAAWTQSPHGALKQMAPRWLAEPPLAARIARVQPAHLRHGGDGALYVYLRRQR